MQNNGYHNTFSTRNQLYYLFVIVTLLFFIIELVRCISKVGVIKFYLKRWIADVEHSSLPGPHIHPYRGSSEEG